MRITDAPAQRPSRSPRRVDRLRYADRLRLPVGQKVSAPGKSQDELVQGMLTAVGEGGFELVESSLSPPRGSGTAVATGTFGTLIAERKVRQVATSRSMRASMAVLVGAGVGLGALDAFLVGSWVWGTPWVAVAGVGAFLLWLRYGRTYESEVLAAFVAPPSAGEAGQGTATSPAVVLWTVGRVRSVAFSGARAAIDVVDCPVALMETLAQVVRRFQTARS